MSCEHLICAACANPVVEGRCPACRAARDQVHHHHQAGISLPVAAGALLALLLLLTLALRLAH